MRGIAISLGDYAPSFDDMWLTQEKFLEKEKHKLYVNNILKPNTQDTRFIGLQRTNQLENTLYLDQPKVKPHFINISSNLKLPHLCSPESSPTLEVQFFWVIQLVSHTVITPALFYIFSPDARTHLCNLVSDSLVCRTN